MRDEFKFLLKDFNTNFPEDSCTNKSIVEEGIFESNDEYICIIEDSRFNYTLRLEIMCPYIFESENHSYFGWYSKNMDNLFFSSKNNPIHSEEDEYVIAWRKVQ
jgi:hypothetical protein